MAARLNGPFASRHFMLSASPKRPLCFAIAVAFIVAGASINGCSSIESTGTLPKGEADAQLNDNDAGATQDGAAIPDAGATKTQSPYTGSPLCHASSSTCFPDLPSQGDAGGGTPPNSYDGGPSVTCGGDVDGGAADGGSIASDSATASMACRVRESGGMAGGPVCNAAGAGLDGSKCMTGADCAPGFDCVGDGVCRQYCCASDCEGKSDGMKAFCDIVPLHEETTLVPACVPVMPCKLLDTTSCGPNKTCSIVRDDGTTSCIATGAAGPGDSCDATHCGAGLVCLGQAGARQCFQLCDMTNPTCPDKTMCMSNALSHDSTVGICEAQM
jgi:hypothetical protein